MTACVLSYPDGFGPTYLDVDPARYDDRPAERRVSAHATAEGRVWQDFGAPDIDRQIRLRVDWMAAATLAAFRAKYQAVGQVWRWVDHRGQEYRVFFRSLIPERIRAHEAYRVELVFDVIEETA